METGSKQKQKTAGGKLTVKLNKRRLLQGDVRYKFQNQVRTLPLAVRMFLQGRKHWSLRVLMGSPSGWVTASKFFV